MYTNSSATELNNLSYIPLGLHEYRHGFMPTIVDVFANGLYTSREIASLSDATVKAKQYFTQLLSGGLATPNHYFYSIHHLGKQIGFVWYYRKQTRRICRIALVYITESFRRRGFAKQAMRWIEQEALKEQMTSIELNVFCSNRSARNLYDTLGYQPDLSQCTKTRLIMTKFICSDARGKCK